MTEKQAEYRRLRESGYTVMEAVRLLGERSGARRISAVCPYSSSCFTCPLTDCMLDDCSAVIMSVI